MNSFPRKQCEYCKQWKQLSEYNFLTHNTACKLKYKNSTPSVKNLWKQSKLN